jgi:DNA-binding GntR family transcriptional regulator
VYCRRPPPADLGLSTSPETIRYGNQRDCSASSLPRTRRGQQVAQELQTLLRSRGLAPGERIGTETELAELLGVSRPTLRQAVRLLASGHLVRSAKGPGGGVFVETDRETDGRTLTTKVAKLLANDSLPIEEMLEACRTIEVPIAALAAVERARGPLEEVRSALTLQAKRPDDVDPMRETDLRFHRAIAALRTGFRRRVRGSGPFSIRAGRGTRSCRSTRNCSRAPSATPRGGLGDFGDTPAED